MLKNKLWLGIILSIFLMLFSANGFALYYKYTMESGANFYVLGPADKADALENHNEVRQILDDLGNLLVHSKRDGSYPKDLSTGGTLTIPNSALALLATGTKGDILYCSADNVWSKLSIGADNQVLVVSTDVSNWETLTSDLLSDVASIAMLDENEAITGDWTVTGSIGGVDTTEFGYLANITAFGASIIDDANEAAFKATVNLEIGTDVLAYQAIGIADDNLVEIDDADAVVDDYCKLTVNGIVGRSYTEVKTDLGIDLSLYYEIIQIDTQGEMEIIWGVTLATDSELGALTYTDVGAEQADAGLTSLAGLTYISPSFIKVTAEDTYVIRTIAETKIDLSLNLVENTTLSTWAGTESITTLGTITSGIWSGTSLVIEKLPTAVVSDGDTAHIPTSDNVYDFCETTQNYALNSELHTILTLGTTSGLSLDAQELSLAINSDTSAGAVTSGAGQNQRVWKTDAAGVPGWRFDEGGVEASTFVALSDTPTFYTDQAHKFPRVNAAEDGMEFYTMPGGGDVLGPATSADNSIVRFDGTDSKTIQDSLININDAGSINIPLGQKYKINDVNLSYVDVGAIADAADTVVSSHIDWGSGAGQIDTDDVPEGAVNLYQLTGEEVDDYVYALINDEDSVHTLITITYDDINNAYDFVVTDDLHEYDWANVVDGDIPNDITIDLATLATTLTIVDNEATDESNAILFTSGGVHTGNLNIESDGDLVYNPLTGTLSAPFFAGDGSQLTGVGAAAATALTITAKAAENINKGQVVYISGATGQTPEVSLADNTDTVKHYYCGIAAETKTTGQIILIRVRGELTGLATDAFLDSDELYLSTAGALTKTEPTSGAVELVGYCSYSHATLGKIIIIHHAAHSIHVPSGDDIVIRMGDALGAKKVYFKDYANVEVAFIDSDGKADFTSLTLDTALLIAEGGTNSGAALANDLVMISNAGAIVEGVVTVTELGRLDGLGGIIVTDVTECTDLEGTLLSIGGTTLNAAIPAGHITEAMLDADAVAVGDILTYDDGGVDFLWKTLTELGIQPLDTALTNISGLAYVSPSFIKLTAEDTYAVRTIAEVKTDLAYSDAEIKAILDDEVTKTGDFTAGRMAKINNATGIIEQGTNTDTDVADAVTKKHTQNTDTAAGGEWDFGANTAGFTIQTAGGDGTTTIDWTAGNYFKFTHGAMAETFTFDPAPTNPGHLTLILIQDGTGGRDSTWPAPVKWLGDEPTWTDGGAGKGIVVALVWDGTTYWGQGTPWEE